MNRRAALKCLGASAGALLGQEMLGRFAYAVAPAQSNAVFNQLGYLPTSSKIASVPLKEGATSDFRVFDEHRNKLAYQGVLSAARLDEASGDRVAAADFSALTKPGTYRFSAGTERSGLFTIDHQVYRDALRRTMRGFYGQRCGCAVDLGGEYRHPACHLVGAYHVSSGRQGSVANSGGWHDAGDYGRYVVNSGLSTATLLWAWELYSHALHKLSLGIPESGGKIPDFLAEVRWNLNWMLSMQDDDGGVWHKQTSEHFCAFIMPQKDTLTSYVIGTGSSPYKSTCATGDVAAVMAIAARCYRRYDSAFSERCLAAAKRAWTWAVAHPDVAFTNPQGITTGEYDDGHCGDEILWASAELWRTTGESQYELRFLSGMDAALPLSSVETPSWANVEAMAYWAYAMEKRGGSQAIKSRIVEQTQRAAQDLLARGTASGYGSSLAPADYTWGSNSVAANQSLLLLIADRFHTDRAMREGGLGNLHYLLGRNCFGVSWVTQVGTNPFQHPHHRPSVSDGIAAPWPGLMSGGPNAKPADTVARTLPKQPPMRMWIDNDQAYSMNEIAINWNAPLVFLLAAANT
jgi:endoglucanase